MKEENGLLELLETQVCAFIKICNTVVQKCKKLIQRKFDL